MQLTTLQSYIENRKREWDEEETYPFRTPFEEETLIYCIQEWESMHDVITDEEYEYLEKVWNLNRYEVDYFLDHEFDSGYVRENEDDDNEKEVEDDYETMEPEDFIKKYLK